MRVANALAGLPKISASFAKGELSYSKVRAMTRVATPDNEDFLLNIAHHGTAHHMERLVSQYVGAKRRHESGSAEVQCQDRSLSYFYDDDGSLVIKGRLPAEQGAMLIKALEMAIDSDGSENDDMPSDVAESHVTAETRQPLAARRADAIMEMAESYLARGPKSSSSADRYQVMLHVTAETRGPDTVPVSHINDGPHVTAETSRRICCDSSVSPLLTGKHGEPLNIGRKSRTIPPPMRRAMQANRHRTKDQFAPAKSQ